MEKELIVKINGKVQGVFFRAETQKKAFMLGLTGWVCNIGDDAVKLVAQGEEKALNEFLQWCKKGPDWAEVKKIEIQWQEPNQKFSDFSIRY